jgi:hypothetical protein
MDVAPKRTFLIIRSTGFGWRKKEQPAQGGLSKGAVVPNLSGRNSVTNYAMFWFTNSQLTRFHHDSTNLARALR